MDVVSNGQKVFKFTLIVRDKYIRYLDSQEMGLWLKSQRILIWLPTSYHSCDTIYLSAIQEMLQRLDDNEDQLMEMGKLEEELQQQSPGTEAATSKRNIEKRFSQAREDRRRILHDLEESLTLHTDYYTLLQEATDEIQEMQVKVKVETYEYLDLSSLAVSQEYMTVHQVL